MGIPKLTTFVNRSYDWKSICVFPGSKIVIDGYSLCYPLYNNNHQWQCGGDYCEFYDTVTNYFQKLNQLKIEPYVVIDGVDCDSKKLDTDKKRDEARLKAMNLRERFLLPLFAKLVFIDVLRDMDVKFYVADGEADRDVVCLANFYRCPVLGRDSDYFIFNIEGGYIPICDGNGSLVDLSGVVKCFKYRDFDRQFFNGNPDLRLYLPVFLGNDFQKRYSSFSLGIDESMSVSEVVDKVESIDRKKKWNQQTYEKKKEVSSFYRMSLNSQSYDYLARFSFLRTKNVAIPQWVLDLYKRGQFMRELMYLILTSQQTKLWKYSVVVEDVIKPSAWDVTEDLKRSIVGLLFPKSKVSFMILSRFLLSLREIYCLWSPKCDLVVDGLSCLADIPSLSVSVRKDVLLGAINCKDNKRKLESDIPDGLKLAVVASRRWLKEIQEQHSKELLLQYVQSLVCCILSCYSENSRASSFLAIADNHLVHIFAQWQCILHHVIALNQVLCLPYQYTSVAKLFSGSLLHHYLQNPQLVREKMDTLANAKDMLAIITRDVFSISPPEADN